MYRNQGIFQDSRLRLEVRWIGLGKTSFLKTFDILVEEQRPPARKVWYVCVIEIVKCLDLLSDICFISNHDHKIK